MKYTDFITSLIYILCIPYLLFKFMITSVFIIPVVILCKFNINCDYLFVIIKKIYEVIYKFETLIVYTLSFLFYPYYSLQNYKNNLDKVKFMQKITNIDDIYNLNNLSNLIKDNIQQTSLFMTCFTITILFSWSPLHNLIYRKNILLNQFHFLYTNHYLLYNNTFDEAYTKFLKVISDNKEKNNLKANYVFNPKYITYKNNQILNYDFEKNNNIGLQTSYIIATFIFTNIIQKHKVKYNSHISLSDFKNKIYKNFPFNKQNIEMRDSDNLKKTNIMTLKTPPNNIFHPLTAYVEINIDENKTIHHEMFGLISDNYHSKLFWKDVDDVFNNNFHYMSS